MEDALQSPFLATEDVNQQNLNVRSNDLPAITTFSQFGRESWIESKKLWGLSGPAILTTVCQYAIGSVTQIFAGHLSSLELAAVSIGISVIVVFSFGFMLGMGSALETLCGQAFGAGQIHMLGVFMQRSWIILTVTALFLTPIYIFAAPILKLLGQADDISDLAGQFSIWMLPLLFAFAINFPVQKFLQSQSKVMVMAWISALGLIVHVFLCWLCISKLGWGLVGAALTLNISWWILVIGQVVYAVRWCPGAWTGLSLLAFYELWAFVRLSLASAIMLCLEVWYFMTLIVLTGHLKNAEIAVDSISICMNLNGWEAMIFIGMNAAISVRVSNELGAGHPRATKFSVIIAVATSLLFGIICMVILLLVKDKFSVLFTDSKVIQAAVSKLAILLAVTMLLNSVQPVLSGVAIGGGWQALIAYINLGCYYVVGVPVGLLLGYKFNFGVKGIWSGMIGGTALQTFVLLLIIYFTNWNKEASAAEDRIKLWCGSIDTNILHALSQIHTRRRVLLSGTLFQNNFKELFNLLRLVRPNILDLNSFQAFFSRLISIITATERHPKLMYRGHVQDTVERIFSEVLGYALQSSTEEVKTSTIQDLQELTSLFVHYYKGDVLEDLPGLVDFTVKLNLNDKQRGALSKLQHFVGNRMSRDIMSAAVCIHPSLEGENPSGWLEPDMTNIGITLTNINADPNDGVKTKFVLDILSLCETNKEKLLVFSQYLPPLTLLEKMLVDKKNWSKGSEILRLDGNTPIELRENIIEQFNQASDSKVLFASIRACGEGICLTGASRVIILDTPWNPSITRQAISRAYRIGQKRKVFAYRLVAAGTLEEEINQASLKKELMSRMLFEGSDQHNNSVSLLSEVNVDECEDMFFQGDSPLKENLQALYRHILA